ncbi:hypothetical protein ACIQZI_13495 [Peribacillus sp. NPDC096379]|uniref:hypothetical protein n=1 Tax=Peribacillus sp. NPDC096379 TaxID=3364393 RepID=UPI000785624E
MDSLKSISDEIKSTQHTFLRLSKTKRLVLGSLFASLAALFQSAGGLFPGIGYFISPLATAPILFCSMLSIPLGWISYLLTIGLLLILQPSELIIFPFTTGLLGIGAGAAFYFFKTRVSIIVSGATLLTIGIIILLYGFEFPVLGPTVSQTFSFLTLGLILLFAILYNWVWVEISITIFKRVKAIISS